jgi:hypothetical protein
MEDFSDEKSIFSLPFCDLDFDFSKIWRKK